MKEAVGAALIGAKAPFRLVQDHSRSGRLEAAVPALRKWLLSDAFGWCARQHQGRMDAHLLTVLQWRHLCMRQYMLQKYCDGYCLNGCQKICLA